MKIKVQSDVGFFYKGNTQIVERMKKIGFAFNPIGQDFQLDRTQKVFVNLESMDDLIKFSEEFCGVYIEGNKIVLNVTLG